MLQVIAALVAPAVGALIYLWLHNHPKTIRLIDTVVYVALPLLVAWQVLPHALLEGAIWPVVAVAAGAGSLYLIERFSHTLAQHADNATIMVAASAMVLHAMLEGGALLTLASSAPFMAAVILHRIAAGLLIWWLLQPRHGTGAAVVGVGALIGATLIGYGAGAGVLPDEHGTVLDLYQGFVAGSLLHVVFHQGRHDHQH